MKEWRPFGAVAASNHIMSRVPVMTHGRESMLDSVLFVLDVVWCGVQVQPGGSRDGCVILVKTAGTRGGGKESEREQASKRKTVLWHFLAQNSRQCCQLYAQQELIGPLLWVLTCCSFHE